MAMTAWLWSGVVTVMASMTFSFSSMRRKSRYLAAFSYMARSAGSTSSLRRSRAIISSSTSQRATMFSERTPRVSEKPMPPTPTQAMLSVSLGAFFFWVAPTTWRGTIMIPAAAVEAAPRNFRRLQDGFGGRGGLFRFVHVAYLPYRRDLMAGAIGGIGGFKGRDVRGQDGLYHKDADRVNVLMAPGVRCQEGLYHKGASFRRRSLVTAKKDAERQKKRGGRGPSSLKVSIIAA